MSAAPAADRRRPLRYLLVGALNTAFAYALGGGLYEGLHPWLATPVIGLLTNLLSIAVSWYTQRNWVFRSRAPWRPEIVRGYAVYSLSSGASILVQWGLVDGLGMGIWWAQAIVIPLGVALSYLGHARFTFAQPGTGTPSEPRSAPISHR